MEVLDYAPYRTPAMGVFSWGTWTTRTTDMSCSSVDWAAPLHTARDRELFCVDENWVYLTAYVDLLAGRTYAIKTRHSRIRYAGGDWQPLPTPPQGQIYMARHPGADYEIEAFIFTLNDAADCAAKPSPVETATCLAAENDAYHKARYEMPKSVLNPCMGITLPAYRQTETYWDRVNGWQVGGSGDIGPDGLPTGNNVAYVRYQDVAKGKGFAWTEVSLVSGATACLLGVS